MLKNLLLLIALSTNCLYGQFADLVMSSENSQPKRENFSGFIGENKLSVFTVDYTNYSKRKQELVVKQHHSGDLSLMNSQDIYSIIDENYTNEPEELYYQNNQFYLFSYMESIRDKSTLLALEVFTETFNRLSVQILDTVKTDEIQIIEEANDKNGFVVAKHLKFTQLVEQEIDLLKLDNLGAISWRKTIKSPMALQNLRIEKIAFNQTGPIYLLCNYAFDIRTEDALSDQQINNKYALWSYDHSSLFLKEFEIRLKSKWVNGIELTFNPKQDLLVSGYFNETKNQAINGVFSLKINKELELLKTSWYKFEPETITLFEKNNDSKKPKELNDYFLRNVAMQTDGSYYMIGEQYYKYIERSYDPRTNVTTTTEHFNYNSIIVSYFDKMGVHQWTDRVPKFQNTTNDYRYSSLVTFNSSKGTFVIFNDTEKNVDVALDNYEGYSSMFNNRKFVISYVQLDKAGVKKRATLVPNTNDYMLRPKLSGQLDLQSIYLFTETNGSRSNRFVKVSVKD